MRLAPIGLVLLGPCIPTLILCLYVDWCGTQGRAFLAAIVICTVHRSLFRTVHSRVARSNDGMHQLTDISLAHAEEAELNLAGAFLEASSSSEMT